MDMNRIVGLDSVKAALENIVSNKELYRHCNVKPNHIIFSGLSSGNGCSEVCNFITDSFIENCIGSCLELDPSIELKPDGKTKERLDKVFSEIDSCSVYSNHYNGLIFINLDGITPYATQEHISDFISELETVAKYATLFFFINSESRNAEILVKKIKSALVNVDTVEVQPYSVAELAEITALMLDDHCIALDDFSKAIICEIIADRQIKTAKECVYLKNELVKCVSFETGIPVLSLSELRKSMLN